MYEIAASEKMTTSALIEKIDSSRNNHNVSSTWFRESDLGFSQDEGYYTLEDTRIWVNEVNVEEAGEWS